VGTSLIARSLVGMVVAGILAGLALLAVTVMQDEVLTPAPMAFSALPYGPDTCKQGYVWREAQSGDHVCVTPETRQTTWNENALAASRREPNGGAYGANTCKPGYVWREAFAADLICVAPDRRAQAKADNAWAAARRAGEPDPEALRPGPHTVVLNVGSSLVRRSGKLYPPTCTPGNTSTPTGDFAVGWGQIEADGDPCQAGVVQTAVRFDEGPLNQVPVKSIDRAILTYGEAAAQGCGYPPGTGTTCWRSGSGAPEPKPNGCVAVLGFPTVNWINAAAPGLVPHMTTPHVTRTSPREWDVSAPYRWQYTRSAPLGGSPPPPFGFLLSGGMTLDQLHAEDNTNCVSSLSNLQLHVTYTVPSNGGPFIPPR
jgi:hypothetical protein